MAQYWLDDPVVRNSTEHVAFGGTVISANPGATNQTAADALYDSPKVVLPAAFRSVNRVYESGDFKTYLMYKPAARTAFG